ncbi:gamma interferon inducible lysosomal thiol reductase [Gigaspora margarita]|uniref:Gamma interferon inducible lysosomal thiol reductase n=1 Tax=Gigaspora margarita TaxID=4874 RepID=A0A8H3WX94_GIGMA|nr:gamma interferon inducible lysosomal thiol reductase [Gigaspora margarita]
MRREYYFFLAFVFIVGYFLFPTNRLHPRKVLYDLNKPKVPVQLFVMSRCPDAVACESVFGEVLKQTNDITTIRTNYVATLNDSTAYGASCKHEDIECIGNIQQLCFRFFYPDQTTFFNFLLCLNRYIPKIGSRDWAMQCSKEVGVDYTPVDKCANSNHGRNLFIKSVGITNSYGVTKSCTIYMKGKLRCIKDDSWYDCPGGHEVNDFVRSIQDAYEGIE